MSFLRRAVGIVSRRLDRPELLSALYPEARQIEHDAIAVSAILAATLSEDSTYVDVGTNRGQVLSEAVRIAPNGRHVAFEPIPALAAEVRSAFPSVDCRPLALGAVEEVARFCHFTRLDGWSGLRRNSQISDEQGEPEFIDVNVSTLDAELTDRSPSVIKIDVEGAELAVLQGGLRVLERAHPVVIFEHAAQAAAAYDATPDAIWDLLAELGYLVYSITGEGPFTRSAFTRTTGVVNWLASPARVLGRG